MTRKHFESLTIAQLQAEIVYLQKLALLDSDAKMLLLAFEDRLAVLQDTPNED